jgi:mono/diheme cytochrome c family protein
MMHLQVQILFVAILFAAVVDAMPPDSQPQQDLSLGRDVFLTYCSGCHGFNGLAFYPPAPSFAMNDRLAKSDLELMDSILKGKGAMPWWEGKLPRFSLEQALAYIRHMAQTEDFDAPSDWDGTYYIFPPVGTGLEADWPIP